MPGDISTDQKLEVVRELSQKFGEDAELEEVMRTLDGVIAGVETQNFGQEWEWDKLIEAIKTAPDIDDDGNDWDLIDHVSAELAKDDDDEGGGDDDESEDEGGDDGGGEGNGDGGGEGENEEQP